MNNSTATRSEMVALVHRLREPFAQYDSVQFHKCRVLMQEAAALIERLSQPGAGNGLTFDEFRAAWGLS